MQETPRRNKTLALVAAGLPLLFLIGSCGLLWVGIGPHRTVQVVKDTNWSLVIFATAVLGAIVTGALLRLAARGSRVPAVITVFVAAVPWLISVGGAASGVAIAEAAVMEYSWVDQGLMTSRGLAQALGSTLLGAASSSALLLAVGIGLALGAAGQRAPGRRGSGAIIGIASALPLLGLAAWVATAVPVESAILGLVGVVVVVVCAVSAASAGADEPHRRSGALAAAAAAASGLAFVAVAQIAYVRGLMEASNALAHMEFRPISVFEAIGRELSAPSLVATWGGLAALLPILAVAGWAARRGGVSLGRGLGAGALAVLTVALLAVTSVVVTQQQGLFAPDGILARLLADVPAEPAWLDDPGALGEPPAGLDGLDISGAGVVRAEVIWQGLQHYSGEVRSCYEREFVARPDLEGTITIEFMIDRTGYARYADVADSGGLPATLRECITTAVSRWAFPPPEGGTVEVRYPFTFQPGDANGATRSSAVDP